MYTCVWVDVCIHMFVSIYVYGAFVCVSTCECEYNVVKGNRGREGGETGEGVVSISYATVEH